MTDEGTQKERKGEKQRDEPRAKRVRDLVTGDSKVLVRGVECFVLVSGVSHL